MRKTRRFCPKVWKDIKKEAIYYQIRKSGQGYKGEVSSQRSSNESHTDTD